MQRSRNLHKSLNFNHPRVAILECIDMVISLCFSLNNMRTALRCIVSNLVFEYSILSNSKFSNLTDIRKCRIPKSNYSKMSNTYI